MPNDSTKVGRRRRTGLQGAGIDNSVVAHPTENREYIVPILCRAFQIIELLRAQHKGMRLEDIHQATGVPKSTAYCEHLLRKITCGRSMEAPTDGKRSG
jgi:hypothetical protein